MAIDRRTFLGLGLAVAAVGRVRAHEERRRTCLVGCRADEDDQHYLSGIDTDGRITYDVPLPARGHGFTTDPRSGRVAVFARRPGDYVWLVDGRSGEVALRIRAAKGRHFYGHGAFTPDGRLLCSENAYGSGDGVIGIYDVHRGGARLGELRSHGIGPHEILLKPDGRTLVVANGGIRTHPDLPRIKQNLEVMRPNLARIDITDGRLLHRAEPPSAWHQLSIRHIAMGVDDTIAVAMQYEGHPVKQPPLVAVQRGDGPLELLSAPGRVQRRLRNYCGSVAFDRDGRRFAVTSPRGGTVTYWGLDGEYLGSHAQPDACGVAMADVSGHFIVSDGGGVLARVSSGLSTEILAQHVGWRWDNHLIAF